MVWRTHVTDQASRAADPSSHRCCVDLSCRRGAWWWWILIRKRVISGQSQLLVLQSNKFSLKCWTLSLGFSKVYVVKTNFFINGTPRVFIFILVLDCINHWILVKSFPNFEPNDFTAVVSHVKTTEFFTSFMNQLFLLLI